MPDGFEANAMDQGQGWRENAVGMEVTAPGCTAAWMQCMLAAHITISRGTSPSPSPIFFFNLPREENKSAGVRLLDRIFNLP